MDSSSDLAAPFPVRAFNDGSLIPEVPRSKPATKLYRDGRPPNPGLDFKLFSRVTTEPQEPNSVPADPALLPGKDPSGARLTPRPLNSSPGRLSTLDGDGLSGAQFGPQTPNPLPPPPGRRVAPRPPPPSSRPLPTQNKSNLLARPLPPPTRPAPLPPPSAPPPHHAPPPPSTRLPTQNKSSPLPLSLPPPPPPPPPPPQAANSAVLPARRQPVSDWVRDSKLNTVFGEDGSFVQHISYVSNPRMRLRRMKKEETWKRREELGTGAFGQVYLEERVDGDESGKLRAVKEIAKRQYRDKTNTKEIDYTRELEAIARFSHEKYVHCFVQSFGWYENDSVIFITMEYAKNGNLQNYLTEAFPEEEVKEVIYQLLEGLYFMHENAFAHRDLKPENVLVFEPRPTWWVKISDFGISKRAEEEITAFHTVVGTKGYLAPELIGIYCPEDLYNQTSEYTAAVDLWSLGAIMFRLLTNQDMFNNPRALGRYVGTKEFPKGPVVENGGSEACLSFLEEVMAPSPTRRPTADRALKHVWLADLHDPIRQLEDLTSLSIGSNHGQKDPKAAASSYNANPSAAWPSEFQ